MQVVKLDGVVVTCRMQHHAVRRDFTGHPARASFEADARRQAASLASLQAETTSASLMASPQNALLNLSDPAALP
jgi:hypothetical protein